MNKLHAFIIGFLVLFILYTFLKLETFSNNYSLVSPENLWLIQGNSLPLKPPSKIIWDTQMECKNNNFPSVTENNNDPHSLFEFAYNKCHPECCKTSSYSCEKGCVCITPEQIKFLANRGGNSHGDDIL